MAADVLVLNRNFYAIHVADWQRALSLVYLDHARVVDEEYRTYNFEDWRELSKMTQNNPSGYVSTPHFRIAIPEVIVLRGYDKMPVGDVKFTRRNIYEHYGHRCCYCGHKFGTSDLNLEHVLPRSRGGKTDWTNIVTSCIPCNLRKADRLPDEAGMRLLIKPTKPKWRGSASLVFRAPFKIKASWQRFIDNVYWNTELDSVKKFYILSALGKDRPGIVAGVTQVLFELGGNLEDASMTRLGGEFSMMLVASLPASVSLGRLEKALLPYKKKLGLGLDAKSISAALAKAGKRAEPQYLLSVYGKDRMGLVFQIAKALAARKASITDLQTKTIPQTGGPLYIMLLEVQIPASVDLDAVRTDLDQLRQDLHVEISIQDIDAVPL